MKIVDLGSGPCNKEKDKKFQGVDITCVDIYEPYLQICKNYGFKTLHADIRNIDRYFAEKSVDIIWLLDVIEHLKKSEGLHLLDMMEKIASRQIIIFTPSGRVLQDEHSGNKYQRHLSYWTARDLTRRGYHCQVLKKYHRDVRKHSKVLANYPEPISIDAMLAIKDIP